MAVTVVRDAINGKSFNAVGAGDARMYLYSESGRLALAVDVAPQEIKYDGFAMDWATTDRSGTKPLLLHKGMPLRAMSFDFLVTDRLEFQEAQTSKIALLRDMSRTFERILVAFSISEQGLWRISDLSVSSTYRTAESDEIARAQVSITLTEASDPAAAVGPISRPPPRPPSPPPPARRTYRVVKGDCLWNIAKRFYGNATLWPRLFDANRKLIRNPHLIYPGQVFVIP